MVDGGWWGNSRCQRPSIDRARKALCVQCVIREEEDEMGMQVYRCEVCVVCWENLRRRCSFLVPRRASHKNYPPHRHRGKPAG
jgi:hypothetical protein